MKQRGYILQLFLIVAIATNTVLGQTSDRRDGMRFVPDVPHAFYNLTRNPDALGLDITTTPDPSSCRHYQSIARASGSDGTPFFFLTRSGNTPGVGETLCDDSDGETRNGHLVVFKMDSRAKDGERLRSNRLRKGVHIDNTEPIESLDRATIYFTVVGGYADDPDPAKRPGLILGDGPNPNVAPHRVYQHPGGMQMVGNILAVALEAPRQFGSEMDKELCELSMDSACDRYYNYPRAPYGTAVHFYDVSNPEEPQFISQFIPMNSAGQNISVAGAIGITPLKNGKYLMVISGGQENASWFFYRSDGTDLSDPNLTWHQVYTPAGPDTLDAHQTLNFLREGSIDGALYVAGARGHPVWNDHDFIDLYKISGQGDNFEPGEITIEDHFTNKVIAPYPSSGGDTLLSLAAASGFYVSPSGELIMYGAEHDNDGPNGSVKAGEWRHVDVVRPGSPTLRPGAEFGGPFEVNEGSSLSLTGTGRPPATKAFIQLFFNRNYAPGYMTVDWSDRNRDDFANLFAFESGHADKAQSWAWFAPPGCSIQAIDRVGPNTEEVDEMKTLTGATTQQGDPDLSLVMHDGGTDDIDREIDRVLFGNDCGNYYNAPIGLFWDLDRNGSFESQGSPVNFSAASIDGPSTINVPVEARHASGGAPGALKAVVWVNNVAPQLSGFQLTDSAGNAINTTVPFVITGMPVKVSSNFTDPGVADRQTASISWGDGTSDEQGAFDIWDEAFGDGTGNLSDSHEYSAAGTYTIDLTVADDDQDESGTGASVRVVTPEQAVNEIVAMIDAAISAATDQTVRAQLQHAKLALTGNNPMSQNGALQMIQAGNNLAAAAFTQTSATWLSRAAQGGADVATAMALVEQLTAALEG